MLTRRTVLKTCAALAATPAALNVASAAAAMSAPRNSLAAFLIDVRFVDARAVGARLGARGVPLHECKRDLAELYCDWLAPLWEQGGAIGGVTGAAPLFYLERLAWSHASRVVFLGRHVPEIGSHAVSGPPVMVDTFNAGRPLWRRSLARALLAAPSGAPPSRPLGAVRDAAVAGDSALFSWVLA